MANQAIFKTFLGKYYDENESYYFFPEATEYGLSVESVEETYVGDYEVAEGELIMPIVLNIRFKNLDPQFVDEDWFLNQPLDKIKKLSAYDQLVKEYGFKDEDYLNGDREAFRRFVDDVRIKMGMKLKSGVKIYLKQYYVLTEDALQELEESDDKGLLEARGFDITKIEGIHIPEIFEELGILNTFLEQNKERIGAMYTYSLPKSVHNSVKIARL